MNRAMSAAPDGGAPRFSDAASSAIRYWEPRRLLYNAVLVAVVLAHYAAAWPASRGFLQSDVLLGFFVLAVVANVAYCAAYAVDLFVQFSGARSAWPRWRWSVLAIGIAFASVLAHFVTMNLLGGPRG